MNPRFILKDISVKINQHIDTVFTVFYAKLFLCTFMYFCVPFRLALLDDIFVVIPFLVIFTNDLKIAKLKMQHVGKSLFWKGPKSYNSLFPLQII